MKRIKDRERERERPVKVNKFKKEKESKIFKKQTDKQKSKKEGIKC